MCIINSYGRGAVLGLLVSGEIRILMVCNLFAYETNTNSICLLSRPGLEDECNWSEIVLRVF